MLPILFCTFHSRTVQTQHYEPNIKPTSNTLQTPFKQCACVSEANCLKTHICYLLFQTAFNMFFLLSNSFEVVSWFCMEVKLVTASISNRFQTTHMNSSDKRTAFFRNQPANLPTAKQTNKQTNVWRINSQTNKHSVSVCQTFELKGRTMKIIVGVVLWALMSCSSVVVVVVGEGVCGLVACLRVCLFLAAFNFQTCELCVPRSFQAAFNQHFGLQTAFKQLNSFHTVLKQPLKHY